jgi:bifunctional DNA-binding transcriptional regulator/antitoxin component of YhaV-PrlF toxin-antitoxin module
MVGGYWVRVCEWAVLRRRGESESGAQDNGAGWAPETVSGWGEGGNFGAANGAAILSRALIAVLTRRTGAADASGRLADDVCLTDDLHRKEDVVDCILLEEMTMTTSRKLTLTAKRQATLPAALCEELGVGPGDTLALERREIDGETVWVLRAPKPDWSWLGAARQYAQGKSDDWHEIEQSIARGWAGDDRP